mmetsp:Transcript_13822/g.41792  ORF Transcript_13822/g.41792 Transcript_13822/m.41792 type:complete len:369 (+) Transcript_13822:140-1246(+)
MVFDDSDDEEDHRDYLIHVVAPPSRKDQRAYDQQQPQHALSFDDDDDDDEKKELLMGTTTTTLRHQRKHRAALRWTARDGAMQGRPPPPLRQQSPRRQKRVAMIDTERASIEGQTDEHSNFVNARRNRRLRFVRTVKVAASVAGYAAVSLNLTARAPSRRFFASLCLAYASVVALLVSALPTDAEHVRASLRRLRTLFVLIAAGLLRAGVASYNSLLDEHHSMLLRRASRGLAAFLPGTSALALAVAAAFVARLPPSNALRLHLRALAAWLLITTGLSFVDPLFSTHDQAALPADDGDAAHWWRRALAVETLALCVALASRRFQLHVWRLSATTASIHLEMQSPRGRSCSATKETSFPSESTSSGKLD